MYLYFIYYAKSIYQYDSGRIFFLYFFVFFSEIFFYIPNIYNSSTGKRALRSRKKRLQTAFPTMIKHLYIYRIIQKENGDQFCLFFLLSIFNIHLNSLECSSLKLVLCSIPNKNLFLQEFVDLFLQEFIDVIGCYFVTL